MPTVNARAHVIPTGTETTITRATIFTTFGNSIRDVVPVANTTARSQLVTDLTAAGQAPSSTKPLVVYRQDAPGLHRLEWTINGTTWLPSSGVLQFATTGARDTWTTTNSAYLSIGDPSWVGNVEYMWSGTAWVGGTAAFTFSGIYSSSGTTVSVIAQRARVHMDGVVTSSSATFVAGTTYTLGSIPVGVAPAKTMTFACSANSTAVAAVTVDSGGNVFMILNTGFTGALLLSLAGLSWRDKNF